MGAGAEIALPRIPDYGPTHIRRNLKEAWAIETIRRSAPSWSETLENEVQAEARSFRAECDRIAAGIDLLKGNALLARAFQAMNAAMSHSANGKYDSWRPFQIGFMLANLPSCVGDDQDVADIVWFSTGGGKTETYLGIILTAAFYDRLTGKSTGITAWSRFPLRLLSLQQAEATVAERRASLTNAQGDVDRLTTLRGTGAIAERSWLDAVSRRDEAAAQLRGAQQALSEQRAGTRRQEIQQSASNVDRAQAAAERIRIRVQDTVLLAPSDGTILTRAIENGANVSAGTTAFTQALAQPVWARIFVDAANLGLVAPGAMVNITTDAAPGKIYRGRVGYVSPTAEFTPKSVETPELRTDLVYRARVIVLNPDSRLRQGMPITVQFADDGGPVRDQAR